MRKIYDAPTLDVKVLELNDVITTSIGNYDNVEEGNWDSWFPKSPFVE